MRIGVGLPTTTAGTTGQLLVDWARRAEAGPFTSLGVLDRTVYDSLDPFVALAAAAAVTTRVQLVTMIVIGPVRPAVQLAKQAASLDVLSGGRLVLGVGPGARPDDYEVAGVDWHRRGRLLSAQLAAIRDVWDEDKIGPRTTRPGGPPLLVGGASGPAFLRMARIADGYVHGGGPPRAFASAANRARAAWAEAGRPGQPALWGQSYVALGDPAAGEAYLREYYSFTGPFAERIAAALLTTPEAVADQIRGYADAGCDELILLPTTSDLDEVDRIADVVG